MNSHWSKMVGRDAINMVKLYANPTKFQGCLVDGARGIYAGEVVQQIAVEYGWEGESVKVSGGEAYDEAVQEAEDYLNDIAPDGWAFGWDVGDFFFMPVDWWREEAS